MGEDSEDYERASSIDAFNVGIVLAMGLEPDDWRKRNKAPPVLPLYSLDEIVRILNDFSQIGDVLLMGNADTFVFGFDEIKRDRDRLWLLGKPNYNPEADAIGYIVRPEMLVIEPTLCPDSAFIRVINKKPLTNQPHDFNPNEPVFVYDDRKSYSLFDHTRSSEPLLIFPVGSRYRNTEQREHVIQEVLGKSNR